MELQSQQSYKTTIWGYSANLRYRLGQNKPTNGILPQHFVTAQCVRL